MSADSLRKEITLGKSLLTRLINRITSDEIPENSLLALYQDACKRFESIKGKQDQLLNLSDLSAAETLGDEIISYQIDTQQKLSVISDKVNILASAQESAGSTTSNNGNHENHNFQLKMPELTLPKFSDNTMNIFDYIQFRTGFTSGLSSFKQITNTTRFMYLRAQLSGKAKSLIENLAVDESTFDTAIAMLDKEFLNRSEIFVATMANFMDRAPATNVDTACDIVLNFQTHITELKKLNYDFTGNEASMELVSMILRSKLPKFFSLELGRVCRKANPSYNEIFENYNHVKHLLHDGKVERKPSQSHKPPAVRQATSVNAPDRSQYANRNNNKIADNNTVKKCKFCSSGMHFSAGCTTYKTADSREKRAKSLNLCIRCLSGRHREDSCAGRNGRIPYPCKSCQSCEHVTPMCKTGFARVNATQE